MAVLAALIVLFPPIYMMLAGGSDIETRLKRYRDGLRYDLLSDDKRTVRQADRTMKLIEDWLEPATPPPTDD